jgi:hypothetical protein
MALCWMSRSLIWAPFLPVLSCLRVTLGVIVPGVTAGMELAVVDELDCGIRVEVKPTPDGGTLAVVELPLARR